MVLIKPTQNANVVEFDGYNIVATLPHKDALIVIVFGRIGA